MNTILKKSLPYVILLIIVCTVVIGTKQRNMKVKAEALASNIEEKRIEEFNRRALFAADFAKCAESSLKKVTLEAFVAFQTLPLGLAWKVIHDPDYALTKLGPKFDITSRLSQYFSSSAYDRFLATQNHPKKTDSNTSFTSILYPQDIFYEAVIDAQRRGVDPYSLALPSRDINWTEFAALARRCNATPFDFDSFMDKNSKDQSLGSIKKTITNPTYLDYNTARYSEFKNDFWLHFTKTNGYQNAYLSIEKSNISAVNELIKYGTLKAKRDSDKLKAEDSQLFK